MDFNAFVITEMKRLSLEELKAKKGNVVSNLEAIKGGDEVGCHCGVCESFVQIVTAIAKANLGWL